MSVFIFPSLPSKQKFCIVLSGIFSIVINTSFLYLFGSSWHLTYNEMVSLPNLNFPPLLVPIFCPSSFYLVFSMSTIVISFLVVCFLPGPYIRVAVNYALSFLPSIKTILVTSGVYDRIVVFRKFSSLQIGSP